MNATKTPGAIKLVIDGMTCGHCVQAVTKALSALPGVKVRSVAVGSAVIEAVDGWNAGMAVAALEGAGYPARVVAESDAKDPGVRAGAGGGCCGGAKSAMSSGAPGVKPSGGCCR